MGFWGMSLQITVLKMSSWNLIRNFLFLIKSQAVDMIKQQNTGIILEFKENEIESLF